MELYSSAFGNHPTPPKLSGSVLRPCRKSTGESGGIQAPGACGPGLQGAWGPGTQGLGPGPPGVWGLFPTNLSNYDFFANLLVGAWRRRGCRLKRLLRRWGPGGKRSRDTPPTPPPPPHPSPAFWGCKGERKRVFTLSAFGNHPTRPPRSADIGIMEKTMETTTVYYGFVWVAQVIITICQEGHSCLICILHVVFWRDEAFKPCFVTSQHRLR